ncbi:MULTISPECIES: DUF5689 domain-containing protein [unclassified Sphingobacterium]|uniref:DUF5689 domain-containing protein n=1 Tax=unclassified Sphingobacterium TaxID=2609468 RepID=UPI0025DFD1D2|nr:MULTISPECIES: DUF5689 domain-containing protein [unclassified Sphingobacterium]
MNKKNIQTVYASMLSLICIGLILFTGACKRDPEAPLLTQPIYDGPNANTTIAALKEKYASINDPKVIDEDLVIKALVTGNDISGNIYKQLYIQDETAAINLGVDQNSMYTTFRAGQEVYISLKGLSMVKYGGELQIGFSGTNANRIAWEIFKQHTKGSGWPNAANLTPLEVDLSKLDASMVNKLVIIKNVRFNNGGVNAFAGGTATVSEVVKDANGKTLDVRNSNFSTFAKEILPKGNGTLVGILGRYNGGWQLFLRDKTDVIDFDGTDAGTTPTDPETGGTLFSETFGNGTYPSGNRPKIADFTDFDMKAPVTYTDASGSIDIRTVTGVNASLWFPANKDISLDIAGIQSANKTDLSLSFQLMSNVNKDPDNANLNMVKVIVNGHTYSLPSTPVSAPNDLNKYYTFTIPNLPAAATSIVEFKVSASDNAFGFRLDNIKIVSATGGNGSDNTIIVTK